VIDSLLRKLGKIGSSWKSKDYLEGGLFSLTSAHVTLETKLGLTSTHRCGICVKNVNGTYFSNTITEAQEFLRISSSEFQTKHTLINDRYGYLWIVIRGLSIEDTLVASNGVEDIITDRGFRDQMLAAVFEFSKDPVSSSSSRKVESQFLIYNYNRQKFYPFVPSGIQEKRRNDLELTIMSIISKEIPWESDMTLWYPLWDMPFDKLKI
jgi:PspA associated protein B